jgi:hypothetical protein
MSDLNKLKELKELLDSGVIEQEEFDAMKNEILESYQQPKAAVPKKEIKKEDFGLHSKLEKIQDLKEKGILTNEEFIIEKNKILNPQPVKKQVAPVRRTQQQVVQQMPFEKKPNGFGIAGFIIALVGGFNWYLTIPFGFLGLIFSIIGLSQNSQTHKQGLAVAGLIISIILLLVGLWMYRQGYLYYDNYNNDGYYYY